MHTWRMKVALLALIFACYHVAEGAHWALLVAGSTGYGNYRHQSDVCHAYQLLRQHGIPADNIITMMYDDIAHNRRNPFQGNIINKPGGPNVYEGVRIDYRGGDVNAKNFLNIIQGKATGAGNGRVINSGPSDNIFIYYSDHGNRNIIAFPGGALYSYQLNDALRDMHSNNQYSKMLIYIEACYSGTMFHGRLASNINVFGVTAANTDESSYSCYYDRSRRTYLADEFSARWMEDSEGHDFTTHTIWNQFINVNRAVRNSHVMNYGDAHGMGNMKIGQFQGTMNTAAPISRSTLSPITDAVPSYDVPYMSLMHQLRDANTTEERLEILQEMQLEQQAQFNMKTLMESIVVQFTPNPALMMQRKTTKTTVEQDDCYEMALDKFLSTCNRDTEYDYAMKDLHIFANLCNAGKTIESIREAIEVSCKV